MVRLRRGMQYRLRRGHVDRRRVARAAADSFGRAVDEALAGIPPPFDRLLDTVAVVVDEWPDDHQLEAGGVTHRDGLYGLYEGIPRTAWGADQVPVPNKISIFRGPLEDDFPDPVRLVRQIRRTVIHELAHHAGIDDHRLRELGLD